MNPFAKRNVPEKIQKVVNVITKRYVIKGECDPMYIANTIALKGGAGDGEGFFWKEDYQYCDKIADALLGAYGCNIFKSDRDELIKILKTGEISNEDLRIGLRKFISYCKEKKITSDAWYREYLDKCIIAAKENMMSA